VSIGDLDSEPSKVVTASLGGGFVPPVPTPSLTLTIEARLRLPRPVKIPRFGVTILAAIHSSRSREDKTRSVYSQSSPRHVAHISQLYWRARLLYTLGEVFHRLTILKDGINPLVFKAVWQLAEHRENVAKATG